MGVKILTGLAPSASSLDLLNVSSNSLRGVEKAALRLAFDPKGCHLRL